MMKRWMILPMMTAMLMGPALMAQQAGNEYVSNDVFTIPKPSGYLHKTEKHRFIIDTPLAADDNFQENLSLTYRKFKQQVEAETFIKQVVEYLRENNYPDIKIVELKDFYMLGHQGTRAVFTFKADGFTCRNIMYCVSIGQDLVQANATIIQESYAEYAPIFDDMLARLSLKSSKPTQPQFAKGKLIDGVYYDAIQAVSMPYPKGMFQLQQNPSQIFKYQNIKPGTRDNKYMSVVYSSQKVPAQVSAKSFMTATREGLAEDGYLPGDLEEVSLGSRKWIRSEMILKQASEISVVQYFHKYNGTVYYVTVGCLKSRLAEHLPKMDAMVGSFRFGVKAPQAVIRVKNPLDQVVVNPPVQKAVDQGDPRNTQKTKSPGTIVNGRFISQANQFSIQVPKTWVYASDSQRYPLKMINNVQFVGDFDKLRSIVITTEMLQNPNLSIEDYLDSNLAQIKKQFTTYQLGTQTMVTVNGQKWGRLSGTIPVGQTTLQSVQFYTIIKGRGYVVSFATTPDNVILEEGFFKGILGTFKYTGK